MGHPRQHRGGSSKLSPGRSSPKASPALEYHGTRIGEVAMADAEIVALRAKMASRPRADDYLQRRRDLDARGLQYGLAPDVRVEKVTANGVGAEWTATPRDAEDAALLYLHGG